MTLAPIPTSSRAVADDATSDDLSSTQSRVEETAQTYNDIVDQIDALEKQIDENKQRISEIEEELPAQREESNNSYVALYKLTQEGCSLIDMLLGSCDLSEFLQNLDYINRIQAKNSEEVQKLADMESELVSTQTGLEDARNDLENQRLAAEDALAQAQEARAAAQAAAEEQKQREAAAAAAAASASSTSTATSSTGTAASSTNAASTNAASTSANTSADATSDAAASSAAAEETPADANTGSNVATESTDDAIEETATDDGADWSSDKQAFVDSWASRIDSYLSGSPLSGQGKTFAAAAWDYGVDPRWSPAISYAESSLGAYCFLPHNAWGWGSSSWDSWEEAIDAHVAGLSRGYGYTLTQEAAKKYCPPNWKHWYNTVAAQMDLI